MLVLSVFSVFLDIYHEELKDTTGFYILQFVSILVANNLQNLTILVYILAIEWYNLSTVRP
jgi:hypothetical protein